MNDAFIAFFSGITCGIVIGVLMFAVLLAIMAKIEGDDDDR